MCERFPLSEGERLNPKIEGDIHTKKITNKCLSQGLNPWLLGTSSNVETLFHRVVLPENVFNNKTLIGVTSALIWSRFHEQKLRKSRSWMRSKFDCTINLSSIPQLLVWSVTKFHFFIIIFTRWPMPRLAWFFVHGDRALHALTAKLSKTCVFCLRAF